MNIFEFILAGREFYKCPYEVGSGCDFFVWVTAEREQGKRKRSTESAEAPMAKKRNTRNSKEGFESNAVNVKIHYRIFMSHFTNIQVNRVSDRTFGFHPSYWKKSKS